MLCTAAVMGRTGSSARRTGTWHNRAQRSAQYPYRMSRLERITVDPAVCHGQPVVRGLRYPVQSLLELLSSGMTIQERLTASPQHRSPSRATPTRQPPRRHPARLPEDWHPLRRNSRLGAPQQRRRLTSKILGCLLRLVARAARLSPAGAGQVASASSTNAAGSRWWAGSSVAMS